MVEDYDIVDTHFCAISSTPQWQNWLKNHDASLHKGFVDRIRVATGCQANRQIMLDVYNKICDSGRRQEIIEFLKSTFPQAVQCTNESLLQLFESNSLTIPKRAKIPASELGGFILKHPYVEHAIIGDYAVVEYLTEPMMAVIKNVPERNWIIRKLLKSGIIQASKI